MDSVFVCHGLTITQSRVLGFLAHHQNRATQKEIEDFLNVSHPTVVGIINRLEQSGFVERLSDPGDRRSRIVSATEQAQSLSHEIELQIDENERQMVRGLDRAGNGGAQADASGHCQESGITTAELKGG